MTEQLFPTSTRSARTPSVVRVLDRRTRQAGLKGIAQARLALAEARRRAETTGEVGQPQLPAATSSNHERQISAA